MDIIALRHQLSINSKNGIAFLLSATVVWTIITVIHLQPFDLPTKNIFMLFSTGIMFPLALIISKLIKADWKADDSPLGKLGLYLNLAQLMYFPIIFWAFVRSPADMVVFFAIITGAHFFPYGWFYHAIAYYVTAPVISVSIMLIGWTLHVDRLWLIPLVMVGFLLLLSLWLFIDYRKKNF